MHGMTCARLAVVVIASASALIFAPSCSRPADHPDSAVAQPGPAAEAPAQPAAASGTVVDGVRVVDVKARRFEFDPSTIVVKQGEKVRLNVTSEDVEHGIAIDGYDIDRKLPPKQTEAIEFTADKPGTHDFRCSIYCGKGHGDMRGKLIVQPAP